ncbi:hypothetical protein PWT90_07046 [Aphanocladium album]|nr:hypothetical protein PWT90_07046 [Aphanocladium album]
MDRSVASVDSCDADLHTPPETITTRPNPFEEDDASSRKRRRTSASASMSPSQRDSFDDDAAANSPLQNCNKSDPNTIPAQVIATPQDSSNSPQTSVAPGSPTSLDPSGQLTLSLRRIVDDNRDNVPTSKTDLLSSGLNTQPPRQNRAPSEDRDMMGLPSDNTSSSDLEEVVTPPEAFPFRRAKDDFHEPIIRLTQYLRATEPNVDTANLEMLSVWMQSTIKFFQESERTIMNALTTTRAHASDADPITSAIHGILSLYSLFTAALVKYDNATLQLAMASDFDSEEDLALFSAECLHIWYDLLYIEEREFSSGERRSSSSPWTRSEMSSVLFCPFLASHGNTTQWISKFAYDLSKFATPPKFRIRDFALVVSTLSDCIAEGYRAVDGQDDFNSNVAPAAAHNQQNRETWLALSDALFDIIDKNASALNIEMVNRLLRALANMLPFICQADSKERTQPDGVDRWLESYQSKYPTATNEILQKGAPWEWRLNVLSRLIQSGLMQLRVMAVNTLCAYLSDIWTQEEGSDDGREFIRHLGQIVYNELFEHIAGPSSHPEIILAGANAIVFLAVSDMGTEILLGQLWCSIQSSQDPRVADAIIRITNNVIPVLGYSHLVHLCEKFDQVDLQDFSPLLRQLWEASIREMVSKAQHNGQALTAHPFLSSLRVLREVPTCDNGARYMHVDLQMAAIQRVKELLSYGLEVDVRHELYKSCVSHLESDSKTTLGSLWFLSICIRPAIAGELRYLTETHDIVRVVVEELESALGSASSESTLVLAGHANQARRDFISQIIHFQPKSLTEELGARLWELLVGSKALNAANRSAAWQTISTVGNNSGFQNSFLQTCFSKYLPQLSPEWYCEGMLSFVKENIQLLVSDREDFNLDDEEFVAQSGVEHLWRIIRFAQDEKIARSAMALLAVGVYLDSGAIMACTLNRAQNVHLKLVRQCLKLMRDAKDAIQVASSDDAADDDSIVVVEPEREIPQQKREFLRTLRLLHYFLDAYRKNPRYATVDLRSLVPKCAEEMQGEAVELQYQTFSDDGNSEIKPLRIGQENTLASLLATLRDVTGFRSYKAYYRGQLFAPTEVEVEKSLQELGMLQGLILLQKDATAPEMPSHIKPGSSPIEIEILSHFSEFWHYLIMEEIIAMETYSFLLRLPADGQLKTRLSEDGCKYEDEFIPDQPFRLLYTIFALMESVKDAQSRRCSVTFSSETSAADQPYNRTVFNALELLARGLDDERIMQAKSDRVKIQITSALLVQFVRLLDDTVAHPSVGSSKEIPKPSATRMLSVLDIAMKSNEEEFAHLSAKCLTLLLRLGLVDADFWSAIVEDLAFPELMRRCCVLSDKKQFRHFCVSMIEDVVTKEAERHKTNGCMAKHFWNWALETLAAIPDLQEDCHELMKLIGFLIGKMHIAYPESVDLELLIHTFAKRLMEHTCTEDINQVEPCDVVAESLVNLLHICIHRNEFLAQPVLSSTIFVLMKKHLFPHEEYRLNDSLPRIIFNPQTRKKLYECILKLLDGRSGILSQVLQFLDEMVPFYADGAEPYIYDLPFLFEHEKALRSPAGYVGLQNLSNTCYLNSLMTQLYMNTGFRTYLTSFDVTEADDSKALLYETQKLFGYLQESIKRAVDPSLFVGAIKTYDQGPIDIHNQMDVDEFYNLLFDRWEAQLPNSAAKKEFRSIYGGQLVQQIKSKECGHISERLEPFSAIQCDIKGNSTLEDSLRAYVGGETMDGDNKYKCSSCDRHVDAVKRACLKDVPDNVIFHLKRFEFNLQTLQRSKIDDYFAFPNQLDLQPYTVEHLSGSTPHDQQDIFELVGVLVHAGTAESGHYYSYVRERSSNKDAPAKWVEFNDDQVSIWNPASMEASTFGGPDRHSIYEENNISFDKSYSAYMLFYQRVSPSRTAPEPELSTQAVESACTTIDEALKAHIRNENLLLLRRHCLFDPSHAKFLRACVCASLRLNLPLREIVADGDDDLQFPYQLAIRTALSYLDQIFSRNKDASFAISFCKALADMATLRQPCALHILQYFQSRPAIFRSLLLRNPEKLVRAATGNLFVTCLEKLSKSCPHLFYGLSKATESADDDEDEDMDDDDTANDSVLFRAVGLLGQLWKFFQHHIRAWDEYFSTVLRVARLGRYECSAILAADYLEKCLTIVTADRSMELEQNFAKMLQNVYRRLGGQPPSYLAVLATIEYLMSRLEPEISNETIVETADERLAYTDEYLPWTASEVTWLLTHPEQDDTSLFMTRLLEIDQAPEITRCILERILRAGELPTSKLLNLLQQTIRGDATTEPLDAFIRAASVVVNSCSLVSDAQRLIQHISAQAASFQNGEGAAFLGLIWQAMENSRSSEVERVQMRTYTLRLTPNWAPYLLQYPDAPVRAGAEQIVDAALRLPAEETESADGEATALAGELGLAIGTTCLSFLQEVHIKRSTSIEREFADILIRVLSKCNSVVTESEVLDDGAKEDFTEQYQETIEEMAGLVVDRADEDGSDWDGSALTSEPMEEDADTEEALAILRNNGYA